MQAGALRQRVSVQARTETTDEHDGYAADSWTTSRSRIAAHVEPLVGRDLERAQQVDPRISHRVRLRYWRAYLDDCDGGRAHLVYHPSSDSEDDRTFEIVTPPVDVDERHVEIQVWCREVQ